MLQSLRSRYRKISIIRLSFSCSCDYFHTILFTLFGDFSAVRGIEPALYVAWIEPSIKAAGTTSKLIHWIEVTKIQANILQSDPKNEIIFSYETCRYYNIIYYETTTNVAK